MNNKHPKVIVAWMSWSEPGRGRVRAWLHACMLLNVALQTNNTFYAFHVRHDVKANVKSIFY